MTFDSLLNHPIGSGSNFFLPKKPSTLQKTWPEKQQRPGEPPPMEVNAAVAGPLERQVPWIRDFVLPLKAFSVVQKRNWVVVTLLLVLNPMEEMVVQVVIPLMSLTCSHMEAGWQPRVSVVFGLVWGNQWQFGLGLVWLGFCPVGTLDFFWFLPHKCTPVTYPVKINDWKDPDFLFGARPIFQA